MGKAPPQRPGPGPARPPPRPPQDDPGAVLPQPAGGAALRHRHQPGQRAGQLQRAARQRQPRGRVREGEPYPAGQRLGPAGQQEARGSPTAPQLQATWLFEQRGVPGPGGRSNPSSLLASPSVISQSTPGSTPGQFGPWGNGDAEAQACPEGFPSRAPGRSAEVRAGVTRVQGLQNPLLGSRPAPQPHSGRPQGSLRPGPSEPRAQNRPACRPPVTRLRYHPGGENTEAQRDARSKVASQDHRGGGAGEAELGGPRGPERVLPGASAGSRAVKHAGTQVRVRPLAPPAHLWRLLRAPDGGPGPVTADQPGRCPGWASPAPAPAPQRAGHGRPVALRLGMLPWSAGFLLEVPEATAISLEKRFSVPG